LADRQILMTTQQASASLRISFYQLPRQSGLGRDRQFGANPVSRLGRTSVAAIYSRLVRAGVAHAHAMGATRARLPKLKIPALITGEPPVTTTPPSRPRSTPPSWIRRQFSCSKFPPAQVELPCDSCSNSFSQSSVIRSPFRQHSNCVGGVFNVTAEAVK
jgi:hypothetical protein